MDKYFKKFLFSFLAGVILLISLPLPALAQTQTVANTWYSSDFGSWYAKVYDQSNPNEIFGERYTAAQVRWIIFGLVSFLINPTGNVVISNCLATTSTGDATPCGSSLLDLLNTTNGQFKPTANGQSKTLIGAIFEDRSLSGFTYVKNLGRKFHLVPEAKAQTAGFGYTGALGVVPDISKAWTTIRDLSYIFFVFILLIFAFMVMFRIKISPQVVVTVQSALPKIAVALILVTFSYAIAGFLIDIMYVAIGVLSIIFSRFVVAGVSFSGISGIIKGGLVPGTSPVVGYFNMLTTGPSFAGVNTGIFGVMVMYFINYFLGYLVIVFGGFFAGMTGLTGGAGAGGLGGSLISVFTLILGAVGLVVVFIMAIINFFRIILLLARSFVMIIFLTIFAPLQFTFSVIVPGIGFGAWIKSFASKLAVFPVVGAMFIMSLWLLQIGVDVSWTALLAKAGTTASFQQGWPPLLGGSPQMVALAFLLASVAVFLMIPSAGKMVESFMSGKGFAGSGIGEAVAIGGLATDLALAKRIEYDKGRGVPTNVMESLQGLFKYAFKQASR